MRTKVAREGRFETGNLPERGGLLLADANTWWRRRSHLDVHFFFSVSMLLLGILIFVWLAIEVALRGLPGGHHFYTVGVVNAMLMIVPAIFFEAHFLLRDRRTGTFTAIFEKGLQVRAMWTVFFFPWEEIERVEVVEGRWMSLVLHLRSFDGPVRFAFVPIILSDEGVDVVRAMAGGAKGEGLPPKLVVYGRHPGHVPGR